MPAYGTRQRGGKETGRMTEGEEQTISEITKQNPFILPLGKLGPRGTGACPMIERNVLKLELELGPSKGKIQGDGGLA